MGRWLLLTLSIAACGGNGQLRTEVDSLRAEIKVMEARQSETEQRQLRARKPVRPTPAVNVDEPLAAPLAEHGVVAEVQAIADAMCACTDMPCAEKALNAMQTLETGDRPSDQEMKKIAVIMVELKSCLSALWIKSAP